MRSGGQEAIKMEKNEEEEQQQEIHSVQVGFRKKSIYQLMILNGSGIRSPLGSILWEEDIQDRLNDVVSLRDTLKRRGRKKEDN